MTNPTTPGEFDKLVQDTIWGCQWESIRAYDSTWQRDEQGASQLNASLDTAKAAILAAHNKSLAAELEKLRATTTGERP